MTKKLTTTDRVRKALPRSVPQWWSWVLAGTGLMLLGVMEIAAARMALATSANEMDAILKIAFSLAFGLASYGGGIVVAAKLADERKYVRKGATWAFVLTAICFAVASFNYASYVAFQRAAKEAVETRASVAYQMAMKDLPDLALYTRSGLSGLDLDAANSNLAEAQALLARGENPRSIVWKPVEELKAGEVRPVGNDLMVAFLGHFTVLGLGSFFRVGRTPAKAAAKSKRKARPASVSKPKLVASN